MLLFCLPLTRWLTFVLCVVCVSYRERETYPHLQSVSLPSIRLRFQFLKRVNKLFSSLLPLVDLRHPNDLVSIASIVSNSRDLIFRGTKDSFLEQIMKFTAVACEAPKVIVDRMLVLALKDNGVPIDFVRHSTFGRAFQQLRQVVILFSSLSFFFCFFVFFCFFLLLLLLWCAKLLLTMSSTYC